MKPLFHHTRCTKWLEWESPKDAIGEAKDHIKKTSHVVVYNTPEHGGQYEYNLGKSLKDRLLGVVRTLR